MGLHVARQLLDATMLALVALPTTGANVFRNRPDGRSLTAAEMPALLVYLGGEDVTPVSIDGAIDERVQRVRIGLRVKSTDGYDEIMSSMRVEVEAALAPQLIVGPGAKPVQLQYNSMADPDIDGDSERTVESVELEFSAQLFTTAPDTLL